MLASLWAQPHLTPDASSVLPEGEGSRGWMRRTSTVQAVEGSARFLRPSSLEMIRHVGAGRKEADSHREG